MQVEKPELIRNIAVAGHNDIGKTTLVSSLLYAAGESTRLNKVEDGNTVTDFDAEEVERGISIGLAPCYLGWNQHKVNIIDCPGYGIFMHEIRSGIRAADSLLLCVDMVSGPQVTSEKAWDFAEKLSSPVAIHLTRADRENAEFARGVELVQESFGRTALPVQVPVGEASGFEGVVDLVANRAILFTKDGDGKGKVGDIPESAQALASEWRTQLVETVAENDEELMEKFFEEGDLEQADLEAGLKAAIRDRALFPITLSSGLHGIGPSSLLDSVVALLPNPLSRAPYPATDAGGEEIALDPGNASAIVFKTLSDPFTGKISLLRVVSGTLSSDSNAWNPRIEDSERVGHLQVMQGNKGKSVDKLVTGDIGGVAKLKATSTGDTLCEKGSPVKLGWVREARPAISFAVEPKSKGDEEKIGEAINRLLEEDPGLRAGRDPQTGEYLLTGTGQLHVEIAVNKLKTRSKVEVVLHPPKVPYRETVKKAAPGHGRHKKQTGGRGQFADARITLEPKPRGEGYEFADEIFGGSIPQGYRPAVDKGIQEAAARGYLAGCPVVDFKIRLQDGQYHDVDSSEMAFKIAGSMAFKDAMEKAQPTILEPVMSLEISTTEEFMGDIMSDLSQRRGKPQGMDAKGNKQIVRALVPMSEMLNYAPSLRSMTQGRSSFEMEFSHYEEVPRNVQQKIIAEAKQKADAAD